MLSQGFAFLLTLLQTQAPALPQQAAGAARQPATAPVAPAGELGSPRLAALPALAPVEVVQGVQRYYQATQKLEANFRQRYTNTTFKKTSQQDGKLFVEKPGKMRWDYLRPDETNYISDGKTLWVREPKNKQVFKKSLAGELLPVAVTFLFGQGDLLADFTASAGPATLAGAPGDVVVTLTPKAPSAQYKVLHLVVDPRDFHVKESIIIEASGNENRFSFTHVKQNKAAKNVRAALFTYRAGADKGFRIVEPKPPAQ